MLRARSHQHAFRSRLASFAPCKMLFALVISRKIIFIAAVMPATLLLTQLLFAAPPVIHIPRIETAPTLADFEGMHPVSRLAESMLKVTGFIAREPADGAEPTQDTDVYLAYDAHNLYAVFVCWDKEPDKIRARMTRREDIFSDDSAEIMIDTFQRCPPRLHLRRQPFRHPVGRALD